MVPSPRLIILVVLAAPLFMVGAFVEPAVVAGALYLAVLFVYAGLDALLLPRRRSISVARIVPERISLGAPTRIAFEVRHRCRRRVEIRIAEDFPPSIEAEPPLCVATFEPGARATLEYRLCARRRGRFALSHVDVRVLPLLGLFYRQYRLALPAELHVYPNLVNIQRYELLLRKGLTAEQGIARMRQIGQGTEFESLRHYIEGDDMARVDWKATARHSSLFVRNYEPERQQNVLVALDVGRATAGEFEGMSRLDYLVNATLMLAYVVLRQGDWFSLVAFSDRIESYQPPVRGIKNIDRVARALYKLEPKLAESDYAAACRFIGIKNRKRSLICLFTDVIDREASAVIIGYMGRYAHHHLPLAVTLANPEVRAVAHEPLADRPDLYTKAVALDVLAAREEALSAMRHQGVDVLDVNPHALMHEVINRYLRIKATRRL
jgi:uncharacterized protein (DUF58 family)